MPRSARVEEHLRQADRLARGASLLERMADEIAELGDDELTETIDAALAAAIASVDHATALLTAALGRHPVAST